MNPRQQQIDFGRKLRDEGIQRAVDSANKKVNSWGETAYGYFKIYIDHKPRGFTFMMEDFRDHVRGVLPDPPSKRAFGMIAVRARKEKIVAVHGYAKVKNAKAHCANATVWKKL